MKNKLCLLFLIVSGIAACVKETVPECPVGYGIQLYVKDKNYASLASSATVKPVDENLPFRSYVGNIYYTLSDAATGTLVYGSPPITVEGDGKEYPLAFENFPAGRYVLAVWGNLPDTDVAGSTKAALHPENTESTDAYLVADTLTFAAGAQSASLGLERTKGKLVVICSNFPDTITGADIDITSVFSDVGCDFTYSGAEKVAKSFALAGTNAQILETFLAPTIYGNASGLSLSLFGKSSRTLPVFSSPPIAIQIKRNEVTVVEVNYNTMKRAWEILLLIDGQWKEVYNLSMIDK